LPPTLADGTIYVVKFKSIEIFEGFEMGAQIKSMHRSDSLPWAGSDMRRTFPSVGRVPADKPHAKHNCTEPERAEVD
jgi:hypothetical protein